MRSPSNYRSGICYSLLASYTKTDSTQKPRDISCGPPLACAHKHPKP